jgi:hypothetical protein
VIHAALSLFFEEVQDHLGVALAAKPVALGFEVAAKLPVVVDFSVEDDLEGVILIGHGLSPPGEIDDSQTGHAEPNARLLVGSHVVRAAVLEDAEHGG